MTVINAAAPVPEEAVPGTRGIQPGEEGYAEVFSEDGFATIILPPGEVITGGIAARAAEEFDELAGPGFIPLLLEITGVESLTRSARSVFGAARKASAVAVVGTSQVDRVIANFLLGGDLPPCPTRYFSSKSEALTWLESRTK